jgi:hypothetical protein
VIERSVPLLFTGELDSGHCDAVLPVEEKETLDIFMKFAFYKHALPKANI